jgi:hypothetical protein
MESANLNTMDLRATLQHFRSNHYRESLNRLIVENSVAREVWYPTFHQFRSFRFP